MSLPIPDFQWQALDANGDIIPGAKLYTYKAGTTTAQAVYSDAAQSTAHANPVVADAAGRFAAMWPKDGLSYKYVLKDASDVTIYTVDNVGSNASANVINVKDAAYGAVGDGVTDDGPAIQAAIDAAETASADVYFPAGTYLTGQRLVLNNSNVRLRGQAKEVTTLKASGALTNLLHMGATDGTRTLLQNAGVSELTLDGASTCTDAVLKAWCPYLCTFKDLIVKSGSSLGVKSDTSTADINTAALRNLYDNIRSEGNGAGGFLFIGEKDTRFDNLFAHDNTGDGIYWKAFKNSGNDLAETTTCVVGSCLSRGNTGEGFVIDGASKFLIANLESTINGGYGLRFRTTVTGATDIGLNDVLIANFLSRNDSAGGLRIHDSAKVVGAQFGNIKILGPNMTTDAVGVQISGAQRIQINSINVTQVPGTAISITEGTPLGSTDQSSHIQIDNVIMTSCGHASATSNHGLNVLNQSEVSIGTLVAENSYTTGSNYELNIANTAELSFGGLVDLTAAASGNEINGNSIEFGGPVKLRSDNPRYLMRDGVTAPTAVGAYASWFIDAADGDLKIIFADSTTKTIVADT